MENPGYCLRNYSPSDFDSLVWLLARAEEVDRAGRFVSPGLLAEQMSYPRYRPEWNLFVAESRGRIVGCAHVAEEPRIGRIVLDGVVDPLRRQEGIGTALFSRAVVHGRELGAGAAHVPVAQDNEPARCLLLRLGFVPIRRHLELELDFGEHRARALERDSLDLRPLGRGEASVLAALQNRSFEGSWGYDLNSADEIEFRLRNSRLMVESVILAWAEGRPAGYCWTSYPRERGERGRIHMLGVDPAFRRRGFARVLLFAGLEQLRARGVRAAALTVDSENSQALSLYSSAGFQLRAKTIWYERALASEATAPAGRSPGR